MVPILIAALLLLTSNVAYCLSISNVAATSKQFYPNLNETVSIEFAVDNASNVKVIVYEERGRPVRVFDLSNLTPGTHRVEWDGLTDEGYLVPNGAYYYVIEATGNSQVVYDLTDLTRGDTYFIQDVRWDPDRKKLIYEIPRASRVNIRVGLKNNGPLLATVVNWVARNKGYQEELWDGLDASKVLDLREHPNLEISALAFPLSDNAILVGRAYKNVKLIDNLSAEDLRSKQETHKKMVAYSQQPVEMRKDFSVYFHVPEGIPKTSEGVPIVSDRLPLRIYVDDPLVAISQRFEQSIFIDGQYLQEVEAGILPMNWFWNAQGISKGEHYITTNIRSYEGNFGMGTIKVLVK